MGEDWTGAFPVEDALEMVLMFDGTGEITYANAAARSRQTALQSIPALPGLPP